MRPIAECRLGERVVFVIDVGNGQVAAVTNCERVSAVYDRSRWFQYNGHLARVCCVDARLETAEGRPMSRRGRVPPPRPSLSAFAGFRFPPE